MSNINSHRFNEHLREAVRITIHTLNDFLPISSGLDQWVQDASLLSCAHRRNGDVSPNEELIFM